MAEVDPRALAEVDPIQRIDRLERWSIDMERRFVEAFPGGDYAAHCTYHELMIEDIRSRKRLRQAVMEKTITGLVWGLLVGVAIACFEYARSLIVKGPL